MSNCNTSKFPDEYDETEEEGKDTEYLILVISNIIISKGGAARIETEAKKEKREKKQRKMCSIEDIIIGGSKAKSNQLNTSTITSSSNSNTKNDYSAIDDSASSVNSNINNKKRKSSNINSLDESLQMDQFMEKHFSIQQEYLALEKLRIEQAQADRQAIIENNKETLKMFQQMFTIAFGNSNNK